MAKKPNITNVTSGFSSTIALNNNFTSLSNGFNNTLSLDGSTPNAMQTELDLANNNIINAGSVETDTLLLGGVLMTPSGVDPVYSGTISSFGASLIDDADAAAGRTTLGLSTVASTGSYTDLSNQPSLNFASSTPSIDDNGTGNTVVTINSQPNGGSVLVGTTSLSQSSTDGGLVFFAGGGVYIKGQNTNYTSTVSFIRNGNLAGTIGTTGTSVSYNTSSDYRLKEDWSPMVGASERIQSLNPVNFAWKLDGSRVDGFLAHELSEVVPESVTGSKDAVDENGVAEMQGVDQSKLVPLLTAGLQEALTEISSLKARVQALEGS